MVPIEDVKPICDSLAPLGWSAELLRSETNGSLRSDNPGRDSGRQSDWRNFSDPATPPKRRWRGDHPRRYFQTAEIYQGPVPTQGY
jgi:hypothetical protein